MRYPVFSENADIGADEVGQCGPSDERGWDDATGSAEPAVGLLCNFGAEVGCKELECAEDNKLE